MIRTFLIWATLVPVFAQAPNAVVDGNDGRTSEELVQLAIQLNGNLLAGQHQIAMAQGDLLQAGLRANPMLELNAMKSAMGPMNGQMVGVSLPLELYHRRDRRVEVAQGDVEVAEFEQAGRERQVRALVEAKFGEILAAQRDLQFTTDLLDLNREALHLTEARATQGAIPKLDADLLRVEVNRIEALHSNAESKVGVALLELKSLVGLEPEAALTLRGSLDVEPSAITQEQATDLALASRPDLRAARALETVASARLRQAETEGRSDASVSASYQRNDSSFPQQGLGPTGQFEGIHAVFHQLTVGVSITLPVRNKNQGAIASAAAGINAARRQREYAELIAKREVAAAFLARDKAAAGLKIYRDGVISQSRQNLDVVRKVYELGRSQLLDVIAEQRRLIEAEMGYTEALNRFYQADVQLRVAANVN